MKMVILTHFNSWPVWVADINIRRDKSSTHYLGDKNRFDVSSKGPSSGISEGSGKARVFLYK